MMNLEFDKDDIEVFLRFYPNYELRNQFYVWLIGVFLTPITLGGCLMGFIRSYYRFYNHDDQPVNFYPMTKRMRMGMILGAVFIWLVILAIIILCFPVLFFRLYEHYLIWTYLFGNFCISSLVFGSFTVWRIAVNNTLIEANKFGSARFARLTEFERYRFNKGLFIGGEYNYSDQGHILTVAGSRSGKFTNLLAPNLLGYGDIDGSWVIIDPKGEICAVTHDYQAKSGQNVIVLNPWGIISDHVPAGQCYNPLDILDATNPHLVDDCGMIAEMLVPVEAGRNKFFYDSARAVIAGFVLHIALSREGEERSLTTIWKWVRNPKDEWDRILAEMENSDDELNGDNLLFAASEIQKIVASGSNTWGSILATMLQCTDFLKSQPLQKSLQSGFDPRTLAHRNTTLYVIIPADKLQSHGRWLRLIVTSAMRAVIRKPNKRVVFMLDEFAALGTLPEIEVALGAYAGFNVTVWAVLQSLVQLHNLYKDNWQVFVGNSAVRHYFGIHNNFDADYISHAIGQTSHVIGEKTWFGIQKAEATPRPLMAPDELCKASGTEIFMFVDDVSPMRLPKRPYYTVPILDNRAGENPYVQRS